MQIPRLPGSRLRCRYRLRCPMRVNANLNEANGWKTGAGEILSVRLEHVIPQLNDVFQGGETVRMVITANAHQDMDRPILGFLVRDRLGQDLFGENTLPFTDLNPRPIAAGTTFESEYVFRLPMLPEWAVCSHGLAGRW